MEAVLSARGHAARVVRFWLAVEMFTPQRLQNGDAFENVVDVQPGEPLLWEAGSPLSSAPVRADQAEFGTDNLPCPTAYYQRASRSSASDEDSYS
jgi:hypothetical protein